VIRGGGYLSSAYYCRPANRTEDGAGAIKAVSFRVVVGHEPLSLEERKAREEIALHRDLPGTLKLAPIPMVKVFPGTFMMGSKGRGRSASPAHEVRIGSEFYIGESEVTVEQYQAVTGKREKEEKAGYMPKSKVTWFEAVEFCRKLTDQERNAGRLPTGKVYRLPTEAEWEYCCRAGSRGEYCFSTPGNTSDGVLPVYDTIDLMPPSTLLAGGGRHPNAWGIYGMHGGLWEWCNDRYSEYSPGGEPEADPIGPDAGMYRVVRGGCWSSDSDQCASAYRAYDYPNWKHMTIGLRVVLAEPVVFPRQNQEITRLIELAPLKLVAIEPGWFTMGSPSGGKDEWPVHKVRISRPFYIGATEVTQALYSSIMKENPSTSETDDGVVDSVAWAKAMRFCRRLTDSERRKGNVPAGMCYRLPTEAEWEYCCRAGSTTEYCFGDDPAQLFEYGWNGIDEPARPALKKPNAWGLFDMHGNLAEWCLDWYAQTYIEAVPELTDPTGPLTGTERVLRGGWLYSPPLRCRSAARFSSPGGASAFVIGFRVVLGPEPWGEERP